MKKKQRKDLYQHFSQSDKDTIDEMIMMCSEMDGSKIDLLEGAFKLAVITGHMREEDSVALMKKSPYLMQILVGGLNTSYQKFILRQKFAPYRAKELFDGFLRYEKLIRDDYNKHLEKKNKIMTVKPLAGAMHSTFNPQGGGNV